jgi:hypothetical protein
MSQMRDPEATLNAWLDEGPTDLPDVTRRAILTSLPTTPQARRGPFAPWRFSLMNATTRLAIAAIVAVIAIGGAIYLIGHRPGVGVPSPAPTPTVVPTATTVPPATQSAALSTATWVTFISSRHGFTVKYPPTWSVAPATAPWLAGTQAPGPPSAELDSFTDPAGSLQFFVVVSQPLATSVTASAWLTGYEQSAPQMPAACWPSPAAMEHSTVGGQPASIHGGLASCGFTEAIVFAGGRAYELTAYFTPGGTPVDRGLFDALLASVTLDPSAADDSPAPTGPPAS